MAVISCGSRLASERRLSLLLEDESPARLLGFAGPTQWRGEARDAGGAFPRPLTATSSHLRCVSAALRWKESVRHVPLPLVPSSPAFFFSTARNDATMAAFLFLFPVTIGEADMD